MQCRKDDVRVINMFEVLWEFFIQWKPAVLFAVIMAILITGAMYLKNMKSYKTSAASVNSSEAFSVEDLDKEIEETKEGLTEIEQYKVENAVVSMKTINSYDADLSAIEEIDMEGDRINYLTLRYTGKAKGSTLPVLFGSFGDMIRGNTLAELLNDVDPGYTNAVRVMEIVKCTAGTRFDFLPADEMSLEGDEPEDYSVAINVLLLKSTDVGQLEKMVTEYISDSDAEINKKIPHEAIKLISVDETYEVNTNLANSFQKIRTDDQALRGTVATEVSAFTDTQKKLYGLLLAKEGLVDDADSKEAETGASVAVEQNAPAKPSLFSPKYALVGFAGGLFVYGLFILCIYLLTGKVRSLDEVCDCYRIRGIDEIHERRFDTAWRRFMYSKKLYDMHYAKVKRSRDEHLSSAVRYITEYAVHNELKHITIMPAYSDTSEDGLCRSYADGLKEAWSKDAIPMEISKQWTTEYTFEAPGEDEGLVVLMHAGDTAFTTLSRIGGYCQDYSVSVIGTILLEG